MSELNNENLDLDVMTETAEREASASSENVDVASAEVSTPDETATPVDAGKGRGKKKSNKKSENKGKKKVSGKEKLDKLKSDAENMSSHSKRNILLSIISVVVFIAVIIAQFIFQNYLVTPRDTEIVNWMFITGATHDHVEKTETFNQALSTNRISMPLGQKYVHCRYSLPASDEDMMLKIITEYSPMKVMLGSEEIYNNGYGTSDIVGNSYNEIAFTSSTQSRTVDIYIYYPAAFRLTAYYEPAGDTTLFSASNLLENWPVFAGGAIIIAGIALSIATFCLMFRSRDVLRLMWLGVIIILSGFLTLIYGITTHSALITSPVMFGLNFTLLSAVACMATLAVHFMMIKKNKLNVVFAILTPVFAAVSCIPGSIVVTKIAMIISVLVFTASLIFLMKEVMDRSNLFVGHHGVIQVMGSFMALAYVFNSVAFTLGLWSFSSFIFTLAVTIFSITLYMVFLRGIAMKNVQEELKESQGEEYNKFFNAVSDIVAEPKGVVSYDEYIRGFCRQVEQFLIGSNLIVDKDSLSCCAAIRINDDYEEVYSKNKKEDCNYGYIADHLRGLDERFTVGTSFIEIMLGSQNTKEAVILFSNAYSNAGSGLDSFIRSLYLSASAAFGNIYATDSMYQNVEQVFINIANIAEERATGTGKHLQMVSKITEVLCRGMGFDEDTCKKISMASMLHDIGKITTSKELLNKSGALTDDEKYLMKQHVIFGYNMLSGIEGEFFEIARSIILEHHENFDGTGYLGRSGENISLYGRIVKVADVFDALASKRQYKERWSYEDIITYIVERDGTEFDPAVVKSFVANGMEIISIKENENN